MTGHDMIDGGRFELGNHSKELGQSEQAAMTKQGQLSKMSDMVDSITSSVQMGAIRAALSGAPLDWRTPAQRKEAWRKPTE